MIKFRGVSDGLIRAFGLLAILAGISLFVFWMSDIDASNTILGATFCGEEETLERKYNDTDDGTAIDFYCQKRDNSPQNITLLALVAVVGLLRAIIIGGSLMLRSG